MSDKPETLHAIAGLLGAGGWSEGASNAIVRWWRRQRQRKRAGERLEKVERLFSAMVREKLDDRDRLILGKMIGLRSREAFDAGLTMGLMVRFSPPRDHMAGRVRGKAGRDEAVNS